MGADVEDETALPPLPNAPRNETTCSDEVSGHPHPNPTLSRTQP